MGPDACANSEGPDPPAHLRRWIWAYTVRLLKILGRTDEMVSPSSDECMTFRVYLRVKAFFRVSIIKPLIIDLVLSYIRVKTLISHHISELQFSRRQS